MTETITPPRPLYSWKQRHDDLDRDFYVLVIAHSGRVCELNAWKDSSPCPNPRLWHASVVDLASSHFKLADHRTLRDAKIWAEAIAPSVAAHGSTVFADRPANVTRLVNDVSKVLRESSYAFNWTPSPTFR